MAAPSLDSLMKRKYVTLVHQDDGKYFLEIPEVQLVVEGDSLDEAHGRLEAAKRETFERFIKIGRAKRIPLPGAEQRRRELKDALTPFFIKAAVVAFIGVILIIAANVSVLYTIQDAPRHIGQKAGHAALRELARSFEKAAKKEQTPEREKRLRLAIRDAIPNLKPYVDELAPLFNCPDGGVPKKNS